ncbi:transcriptional regulator, y4mF family [Slackia heliotrinireducens]|uniref:Predicted transcriptional regulator n=1 Tax=Slackia heliotrinireducens (strain ATCC 29202 / DSM 20476 / NCTC 11029 / RHS 1) TaxID=471855 RepID=C7N6S7_SLAHD|nr:helix-turn-helix transcriptional regulator [Slackia heliotrinireducens]ACV22612.1 predicted transcriptional regulator [Slackia heliotrinireducens DSM 20476]VEH01133.1 transcriptional regulator, y4mF family [Slackia heliotrinireducens]
MPLDIRKMARSLKVQRAIKGWSQGELAKESGISQNSIARYESEMSMPGFDAACRLADAFGCTLDELAGREAR